MRGRYAWTGREYDGTTGLQDNRARYYDPRAGRWTSQDPLGFDAGDSNLYRYVKNGVAAWNDPTGLTVYYRTPQYESEKLTQKGFEGGVVFVSLNSHWEVSGEANNQGPFNDGYVIGYSGPNAKDISFVQFNAAFGVVWTVDGNGESDFRFSSAVVKTTSGPLKLTNPFQGWDKAIWSVDALPRRPPVPGYIESGGPGWRAASTAMMFDRPNVQGVAREALIQETKKDKSVCGVYISELFNTYVVAKGTPIYLIEIHMYGWAWNKKGEHGGVIARPTGPDKNEYSVQAYPLVKQDYLPYHKKVLDQFLGR
jgi:RHS repeat-associated protein